MLNGLGHVLLRGGLVGDDTSTEFRRIEGNPNSRTVCFLPWCMPYRLAKTVGLVPCDYLVCYEMPGAIVSSEPDLCIRALRAVADDAMLVLHRARLRPEQVLVVGLSIGNGVATYFANAIGAQLCSIASADRGDLTLWESPASRHIKQRAEDKGYTLEDFTQAISGYHSIENLSNLAPGSRFIIGTRDEFVPEPRRNGLIAAVRRELPDCEITFLDETHIGTMAAALKQGIASIEADKLRA
jgi:pimeloyl-ACP methyl ester carboxylesterase